MSPLPEGLITSMKNIFHNAKIIEERIPRHKFVQESILELFNWFNFHAKKEYRISYNRRYRSKARYGEIKTNAGGYIDIYAKSKNCVIPNSAASNFTPVKRRFSILTRKTFSPFI